MATSLARSASEVPRTRPASRSVAVVIRIPLVVLTFVLVMIAFRYLVNPVRAGAEAGIAFTSAGGMTVARVGFGAFPLAFAVFFIVCLKSTHRLLLGLRTELMLLAIVIAVRVQGMVAARSADTARLLAPELVLVALCLLAILLERRRNVRSAEAP